MVHSSPTRYASNDVNPFLFYVFRINLFYCVLMLSHNNSRLVYPQDKHFIVMQQFFEAVLFQRYVIIGFIGFVDYINHFLIFCATKIKILSKIWSTAFQTKQQLSFETTAVLKTRTVNPFKSYLPRSTRKPGAPGFRMPCLISSNNPSAALPGDPPLQ
ncbi:hypothetical protein SDC9_125911 [bioreactor metagenome]|uniref:Uncharacterized protein n=1 Tax=bioreactor metagenome TaxID=1076179 RepID=A0A645CPA9_9ZZZZ